MDGASQKFSYEAMCQWGWRYMGFGSFRCVRAINPVVAERRGVAEDILDHAARKLPQHLLHN